MSLIGLAIFLPQPAYSQTPFTYQGKLESNGSAFTGTVRVRLGLYTAVTGGTLVRQEDLANVQVTSIL